MNEFWNKAGFFYSDTMQNVNVEKETSSCFITCYFLKYLIDCEEILEYSEADYMVSKETRDRNHIQPVW